MPSDSALLTLLLGPAGLTVGVVIALWKFQRGDWQPRDVSDQLRKERDQALALLEVAVKGSSETAAALAERNRLERERIEALRSSASFQQATAEAEDAIRKRRP